MSQQDNLEAMKQFGEAVNSGNLQDLRNVISPTVKDNDPAPDQGAGPEGFIGFFETFRAAFPDLSVAVEHMVADEDNVAFAYTVTGTHQGDFMGGLRREDASAREECKSLLKTASWSSTGAAPTSLAL